MFHLGLPFIALSAMILMVNLFFLSSEIIFLGAFVILVSSIVVCTTPLVFIMLTPLKDLEEERDGENWMDDSVL